MAQQDKNNLLYLYDLPEKATSVQISKVLKDECDYDMQNPAQFIRDPSRPFTNAIIRIQDQLKLDQIAEKMRYFKIDDKQCRSLKFDRDLLGANRQKLLDNQIFIRGLPKEMTSPQLHELFSKFGDIKSLKISINPDYTSRQYGFICFDTAEAAQKALEAYKDSEEIQVIRYQPKDKRDMRKAFNNIYVKNFPKTWTEDDVKKLFSQYGNIKSLAMLNHPQHGTPFAFICFEDPKGEDREYGPKCAMNAVEELNGKVIDPEHTLYVKEALKKAERELEKKKEAIRYKNSKRRCNLYVKNFPPNTTKEQLEGLFGQYGPIESIKIFFDKEHQENAIYAFVCYEKPESAFEAKTHLNQQVFNGKQLYINFYEIKETREIQIQDIKDKADFQKHKKTSISMDQITNKPEILGLLEHLLTIIQPRLQNMYRPNQRRGPMNRGPGQMPQPGQRVPMQKSMSQPMPGMMQQRPPVGGMPAPMGQMPQMGPQGGYPMGVPPQMMGQRMPMPLQQQYLQICLPIIPAVDRNNPNYKAQVGEAIYQFVEKITNDDVAPKITGMLIDLPIEEIIAYLQNFGSLEEKVRQAHALLTEQQQ